MTRESKAGLTCEVINLENGYGYIISTSINEVLIYQPYIPAIEKRIAFESRQDAKKVGDAVCERIKKTGVATLTKEEVRHLLHMD